MAVASLMGKLTRRKVQEGALISRALGVGSEVEIYVPADGRNVNGRWYWTKAVVTSMPDYDERIWLADGKGHLYTCLLTSQIGRDVHPMMVVFGPREWRWPQ